ncbi:hypothetical protein [Escherichia phage phiWec186]|nr:hypothetical protein [Escherichia phage phiWec181]BDU12842.1 hypothetical protein [Escherichia phage phiWec186]
MESSQQANKPTRCNITASRLTWFAVVRQVILFTQRVKGANMNPKDMQAWKGYDDLSALRNKSSRNLRRLEAKKKKK